ncbi:MAG: hypothetical protein WDN08_06130 [Rhizomicrobium sp.]
MPAESSDSNYLTALLPESTPAGPLMVHVESGQCQSAPFWLNDPAVWWVWPETGRPGSAVRLFGQALNDPSVHIELNGPGGVRSLKADIDASNQFAARVVLPATLRSGFYRLRLASGAAHGPNDSFSLEIKAPANEPVRRAHDTAGLLRALEVLRRTGGVVRLSAGRYLLKDPLQIPQDVVIVGEGADSTELRFGPKLRRTAGLVRSSDGDYPSRFTSPEIVLGREGPDALAAVLMFGSHAGLVGLTVDGGGVAQLGIAIAGSKERRLSAILIRDVRIQNLAPDAYYHPGLTEAILARHVDNLTVEQAQLFGGGPALFLEDIAGCDIEKNVLSGGGEGVITGRDGGVHHCIVEDNLFLSKVDGQEQAVRMIWFSTLFGSTYENYIAGNNGSDFHPPPNTDQNRGEAILLETALSHPYFGHPISASLDTISLPAQGPLWSLLGSNLSIRGTRLSDYFVVVLSGRGRGQVRRLVARDRQTLTVAMPWRTVPDADSAVVLTELNYHNIIVDNVIHGAMMGIVLWLNGIENIIAGNRLSNLDREGILIYSDAIGGPQNRTPTWPIGASNMAGFNRGIGPSYFNTVQGNIVDGASIGINVAAGDFETIHGPIDWPTSTGNIVRDNLVEFATGWAFRVGERLKYAVNPSNVPGHMLIGNIVENNRVGRASGGLLAGPRNDGLVILNNQFDVSSSDVGDQSLPRRAWRRNLGWLVQGNGGEAQIGAPDNAHNRP